LADGQKFIAQGPKMNKKHVVLTKTIFLQNALMDKYNKILTTQPKTNWRKEKYGSFNVHENDEQKNQKKIFNQNFRMDT